MKQLDAVYRAFTHLESNYRRSNKTRREYIVDKFGGDVEIGSMVILDYFAGAKLEDPDDIAKFSAIRDIFNVLKKNIDNLVTFESFDDLFNKGNQSIKILLEDASIKGSKIIVVPHTDSDEWAHYKVKELYTTVVPLVSATKVRVFNGAMQALVQSLVGSSRKVMVGQTYVKDEQGLFKLLEH